MTDNAYPTDQYVDTRYVMDRLAISRSTLDRLIRDENLPVVKLGERTRRFDRAELDAWIAARTFGGAK